MPFKKKFMQNYSDGTPPVFPGIPSDPSGPIRPTSTCCLLQLYYPTSNWDIEPDGEKQRDRKEGKAMVGVALPKQDIRLSLSTVTSCFLWSCARPTPAPEFQFLCFPQKSAILSIAKVRFFCHFTFFVFYILVCICVGTALSVYADQKSSWVQREQRSNTKLARDRERTVTSLAHITGCE